MKKPGWFLSDSSKTRYTMGALACIALMGLLVFLLLLAIPMFRSHGHPEELLEDKTD